MGPYSGHRSRYTTICQHLQRLTHRAMGYYTNIPPPPKYFSHTGPRPQNWPSPRPRLTPGSPPRPRPHHRAYPNSAAKNPSLLLNCPPRMNNPRPTILPLTHPTNPPHIPCHDLLNFPCIQV